MNTPRMNMNKMWTALLTGLVGIAAHFVPGIHDHISPETINALAVLLTTAMVWWVPNKPLE